MTKVLALAVAAIVGATGVAFAAPKTTAGSKKPVAIDKGLDDILSGELNKNKKRKKKPPRKPGKKLKRIKLGKIKVRRLTPAQRAEMKRKAKAAERELLK